MCYICFGGTETMKIAQRVRSFLGLVVVFSFWAIPLSYSADDASSSSHQQFLAIVNLEKENSANVVTHNDGVIEFKGNELVDSVAQQMSASGTLSPDSTLALPKDSRNMAQDAKIASTPLALVERDLQGWTNTEGVKFDELVGNATKIAQTPIVIPRTNIAPSINGNPGLELGTGASTGSTNRDSSF